MIKAILFDIGEVLIHTNFLSVYEAVGKRTGIEPTTVREYFREHLEDELIQANASFMLAFLGVQEKYSKEEFLEIWKEEIVNIWRIDQRMMKLLRDLREHYTVVAVTNLTETRYVADASIGLYDEFDHVLLSFKEGIKKPNAAFYELALSRAGVLPQEAVFIDDQQKMVDGAVAVGIVGIQFLNFETLVKELETLGVVWTK